jgi:hypothetical protein
MQMLFCDVSLGCTTLSYFAAGSDLGFLFGLVVQIDCCFFVRHLTIVAISLLLLFTGNVRTLRGD